MIDCGSAAEMTARTMTLPAVFLALRVPGCDQSVRDARAAGSRGLVSSWVRAVRLELCSRLMGAIASIGSNESIAAVAAREVNVRGFIGFSW